MVKYFMMVLWYKVLYMLIACGGVVITIWVLRIMGFGSPTTGWLGLGVGLLWGIGLLYFKVPAKLDKRADKYFEKK